MVSLSAALIAAASLTSAAPRAGETPLTAEQDHQRLLDLLHIKALRPRLGARLAESGAVRAATGVCE